MTTRAMESWICEVAVRTASREMLSSASAAQEAMASSSIRSSSVGAAPVVRLDPGRSTSPESG